MSSRNKQQSNICRYKLLTKIRWNCVRMKNGVKRNVTSQTSTKIKSDVHASLSFFATNWNCFAVSDGGEFTVSVSSYPRFL